MSSQTFLSRKELLEKFWHTRKRMPSYREMLNIFNVRSKQAVARIVEKMIEAGLLMKDEDGKLIPKMLGNGVHILGTVQAGFPTHAEEEITDIMSLDDFLITKHSASFMLQVSGDSMIDAGIQPGDYVVLERGRSPRDGDIVVAEVDHEWTMKFFEKRSGSVILRPANKKYRPIMPRENISVAGVVTAVVRKYK